MQQIKYHDYQLQVNNGVLSSDNESLLSFANSLLRGTFGKFNNSEVYPNKDSAIANFLQEELKSK